MGVDELLFDDHEHQNLFDLGKTFPKSIQQNPNQRDY